MNTSPTRAGLSIRPRMTARSRAWAASGAALAVTMAFVVVGHDRGFTATATPMSRGSAWLASGSEQELTLLDGAIPQVVKHSAVQNKPLATAQENDTAFSMDQNSGTVTRVDGATHSLTHSVRVFDRQATPLIFATPDTVYAVNTAQGQIAELDPATLVLRGLVTLTVSPPQGGTAVAAGRLWLTDTTNRTLTWVHNGVAHTIPRALSAPNGRLAAVNRSLVAVEAETGLAEVLDPASGVVRSTQRLALQRDDEVTVSSTSSDAVAIVTSVGQLIQCGLDGVGCINPVNLGTGGDQLGTPVAFHGRLYVPDWSNGTLVEIASPSSKLVRTAFSRGGTFDLFEHDGYLFFNDPDGSQAGVVTAGDKLTRINKFVDPVAPGPAGSAGPRPEPFSTPVPSQPTTEPAEEPTYEPTYQPTDEPREQPNGAHSQPSDQSTVTPTQTPSQRTDQPSGTPATPDPSTSTSTPTTSLTAAPSITSPTTSGTTTAPPTKPPTDGPTSAPPTTPSTAPATSPSPTTAPTTGNPTQPPTDGPGPTNPGPDPSTTGSGPTTPPTTDPPTHTTEPAPPPPNPPKSKVIFTEDFNGPNRGWRTDEDPDRGSATYGSGRYDIKTTTPGLALWAPAPIASSKLVASMTVKSRGRLVSPDQGGWGLWCLNRDGDRYEFLLSHAGTAVITGPGGGYLDSVDNAADPNDYHTITATCAEDAGGTDLRMSINGRTLSAHAGGHAPWRDIGVHGFSFSNVPDQPLGEAIFTSFVVERVD